MSVMHCCFLLLPMFTMVISQNVDMVNISIPINKTISPLDKEVFGGFYTIGKNSIVKATLTNLTKTIDFIIFQVHTHIYNVTLYNNTLQHGSFVNGTNIGLYGEIKPPDVYYIINKNPVDLNMYISVHGYRKEDPIPGGCNMEFPVLISPFMHVIYNSDMITVDAAPAKDYNDSVCVGVGSKAEVEFYRMYLNEGEFDEQSYFDGLKKVLTLEKIRENGNLIPHTLLYQGVRRLLSAYPGTGSLYVAVAYSGTSYSVYVPTHTYACNTLDGCQLLDDYLSQFFCATLVFIGLFVCFLGHRFFKTEMFLVGMFSGIIVTYILIAMWSDLERPSLLTASFLSGVFFGAIWLLSWWFYGIPVLAVALPTLFFGFMVSSLVYYTVPGELFRSDTGFWLIFILCMLCTSVTLTTVAYLSNLICCSVLGSFAFAFALDFYLGSNLKYIIINTIRRAVVEKFNYVVLAPVFQWRDAITLLLWVSLATLGFLVQHYHNRDRPPFPPPPRFINRAADEPRITTYGTIATRRPLPGRSRNALPVDVSSTASERTLLRQSVP